MDDTHRSDHPETSRVSSEAGHRESVARAEGVLLQQLAPRLLVALTVLGVKARSPHADEIPATGASPRSTYEKVVQQRRRGRGRPGATSMMRTSKGAPTTAVDGEFLGASEPFESSPARTDELFGPLR
jgi:hypothetical protein